MVNQPEIQLEHHLEVAVQLYRDEGLKREGFLLPWYYYFFLYHSKDFYYHGTVTFGFLRWQEQLQLFFGVIW